MSSKTIDWPPNWSGPYGEPLCSAVFKAEPEDFIVEELIDYPLSGEGEFLFVDIEKRCMTTEQAAAILARFAGVPRRSVSWSGMKDKFAVCRQSLAIHLPGKPDPDFQQLQHDGLSVIGSTRHQRKLRIGNHSGNRFEVTLYELDAGHDVVESRLSQLADSGFANYFGEQRFGREGSTIAAACEWLAGGAPRIKKYQLGLYLSALRAYCFNQQLAARVERGYWATGMDGDRLQIRGSESHFLYQRQDDTGQRIAAGDLSPVASLPGKGSQFEKGFAADLESAVLAQVPEVAELLNRDARWDCRALRVMPGNLRWSWCSADRGSALRLSFELPKGSFATSLLSQCFQLQIPGRS